MESGWLSNLRAPQRQLLVQWKALSPRLRWSLGLALLAALLSLGVPEEPEETGRRSAANANDAPSAASLGAVHAVSGAPGSLWRQLLASKGAPLEPAEGDPFVPASGNLGQALQAAQAPAQAPPPLAAATPTPPPAAPSTSYRVVGWLQMAGTSPAPSTPASTDATDPPLIWLLSDGSHDVGAVPGATLRDGFVVHSVSPAGVHVRHPSSTEPILLPAPARMPADAATARTLNP